MDPTSLVASDMASLLQLGSGLGVALSLFRGPFDRKTMRIADLIATKTALYQGLDEKRDNLSKVGLRRSEYQAELKKTRSELTFYTCVLLALAVANTVALVWVSMAPGTTLSPRLAWWFVALSVGIYAVLWAWVELRAHWSLGKILSELKAA